MLRDNPDRIVSAADDPFWNWIRVRLGGLDQNPRCPNRLSVSADRTRCRIAESALRFGIGYGAFGTHSPCEIRFGGARPKPFVEDLGI
jgi:hypothetical protein